MTDDLPQTLIDAVRYFADLDICHAYLRKIRWPGGCVCPYCESRNVGEISGRRLRCKDCRKDIRDTAGTIFHSSHVKLNKWLPAVWCVVNCKNGISSHEMARTLGVTQKTAWFMEHRIREAMRTGTFERMRGEVESDESFIGGEARNMHAHKRERIIRGRGAVGKAIVHGLLERGETSRVHACVVKSVEGNVLGPAVRSNVELGATVYTDEATGYSDICLTHVHRAINHAERYVAGRVHTNGLENFWALLKRGLKGTYVAVAPFHLRRYLDEQVFRFNARRGNDASRFEQAMSSVTGRRLTYRLLTGQGDAGFMGIT